MTLNMTQEEFYASIAWSRVVAACVIRNDKGEYLLVQEAQKKVYGLWNLPAGHVDEDEVIEDSAVRETKEETGLDVKLVSKIGIWHEAVETPVRHCFVAEIIGGELKAQKGEVLDVRWFSHDSIVKMKDEGKLRVDWIFEAINRVENA